MILQYLFHLQINPRPAFTFDSRTMMIKKAISTMGLTPEVMPYCVGSDGDIICQQTEENCKISISWTESLKLDKEPFESNSTGIIRAKRPDSGWQLGEVSFCYSKVDPLDERVTDLGTLLRGATERFYLQVRTLSRREYSPYASLKNLLRNDQNLAEKLYRTILSQLIGEDFDENGKCKGLFKAKGVDLDHNGYEPLEKWKKDHIASLVYRQNGWLATLATKDHYLQLALASAEARLDSKKVDLKQFIVLRQGKWLVPTKVLDEAWRKASSSEH